MKKSKTPLFQLTNRFILFLFSFSVLIFFLYLIGNKQHFLTRNQLLILSIVNITSISVLFFLLSGILQILWLVFYKKNYGYIKYSILYIFIIPISIFFILFSTGIEFFAR